MMKLNTRKQNKSAQYVVGGTVAVIILGIWVSLPLMNGSSMSASASAGNPFKSKVSDISSLGSDVALEGGAPGSALSGEMINNPATSGENILSSLFQSGPADAAGAEASASADASAAPAPAGGGSGAGSGSGSSPSGGSGGKLSAVASIGGSSGGSMTAGGDTHGKFFGGGGSQKAEFAPSVGGDLKKIASASEKKGSLTAMLNSTQAQSKMAAGAGDMSAARGGAAAAFGGSSKGGAAASLQSAAQGSSAVGLDDGSAATGNLKTSDPGLNKNSSTPPAVTTPKEVKDPNEELKQALIKMLMQAALGMIFGGGGGALAGAIK